MSALIIQEAMSFFRSYGIKVEESLVKEWVLTNEFDPNHQMKEEDIYCFNEWCRWKGTAYEEGIDDQVKIERLLEEIRSLKIDIESLKDENGRLEERLGIYPF
jgi:predicted RNase H-like nuclease (RuvC/YqgF family)